MAGFDMNLVVGLLVVAAVGFLLWKYFPVVSRTLMPARKVAAPASSGVREGFASQMAAPPAPAPKPTGPENTLSNYGGEDNMGSVPMNAAKKPKDCYPREQLNPTELLPTDVNSQWAAVNPHGAGDIQGKNFLSAGSLVGVNTVGQSLRNANYQLRAEPPNPQVQVGPWMQTTIEPDLQRRSLE
jgi:hypothetical protein